MPNLKTHRNLRRRRLLATASSLLAAPALVRAQGQTNGVALVIGNSKYTWEASLPNVKRDATDIAKRLQALGLKIVSLENVGREAMVAAIHKFGASAAGVPAVFYFAGHGVQDDRFTFLVPVDADLSDASAINTSLVGLPVVRSELAKASSRLMVLDSCRNNPKEGRSQQVVEDRARSVQEARLVKDPPNTLIIQSTAPGRIALDGPASANSPFAAALLRQFDSGSIDLLTIVGKVRRDVLIETNGRQVVFDMNNCRQSVVLGNGVTHGAASVAASALTVVELPNAFAYAQQAGLVMPAGVVALRSPNGGADNMKVGAYRYTTPVNQTSGILIVLSVEGPQAEIIYSQRLSENVPAWRFAKAKLSGADLQFIPFTEALHWQFTWKDNNAGSLHLLRRDNSHPKTSGSFTRLDG